MAHCLMGMGYDGKTIFYGKDDLVVSLDIPAHQAAIKNEEF